MQNLQPHRGKNKSAETLRPSYARFYASKWRSGTLMLSLEEEGLYIRVSAFQMECGQPIPLDWKAGARLLCVQPLKYRKTIDALIAKRKLITTPDGVICERAMHEFKRASRGVVGEKPNPPTNPDTNPDTYPDTNPVSMGVEAEKDEQNQTDFRNRREEEEKKEKKVPRPTNVEQDAEGPLVGLNGARSQILEKLGHWFGNPDEAADWLRDACERHGAEAVKASYGELTTKIATGLAVAYPISLFETICERRAREAAPAKTFMQLIDETDWSCADE